ncbi:MAG: Type 1 glutamine amidotransferase-like domain-containing protein [Clostridia bacterium]|nr:Type 1 glutamine amidotransferase-like domain-containing protein [Clostridia bacterium]
MGNIVAIGGGFDIESAHRWKMARYLNSLTKKENPNFLLVPASGFDSYGTREIERHFALGCDVDILKISSDSQSDVARKIRWADIIYIPGGNSTYPIAAFRKREADKYLREVWEEKETVLSGKCAGAMFWFAESYDNDGIDDSFEFIKPLGFINYCMCPHFDSPEWMPFEQLAPTRELSSIAIDNGAAICFLGDNREIFNVSGKEKVYLFDKNQNYKKIDLTQDAEALRNL